MRKGSALLIVLGMMAFMVVSAVAFSMFMRQSRLPSSFLRQRVASSQLVKAGLANAMREIDESIGNDPYPGVRNGNNDNGANNSGNDRNYWKNRVFMGENTTSDAIDEDDLGFETVSTLTLEGLAYLPPPLVNTARYWSRRTRTAEWKPLGYDAGRYAYTAINVSDYFDLNRVRANVMRDSSPGNRISMGYLFENAQHTGDGSVSPAAFERFVAAATNDTFRTRLVSMADYNLAVDSGEYGDIGFDSPFCRSISSPNKDGSFYGSGVADAKLQKFVTDSWCPGSVTNTTAILLTDDVNGQPFDGKRESLDDLQKKGGNAAFRVLCERLDLCSLGALYDYVDEDSTPISLAIPTLEHVPMLTGIQIVPENIDLQLDHKDVPFTKPNGTGTEMDNWTRRTWYVKSLGEQGPKITFNACLAYPFKRTSGVSRTSSYEVQVLVKMFLSPDALTKTRLADSHLRPGKGDWKDEAAMMDKNKACLTLFKSKPVTVTEGTDESHCACDVTAVRFDIPPDALGKAVVYGLSWKDSDKKNTAAYDAADFGQTGSGQLLMYRDLASGKGVEIGASDVNLRLNYVVWARVVDGDGNTVDLVPATLTDDQEYNGFNSKIGGGNSYASRICGADDPLLPLAGGNVLTVSLAKFRDDDGVQTPDPQGELSLYCDDPRFNYAPEDWYPSAGGVRGSDWLAAAKTRCQAGNHGQNDVFQFVSDEGYLQSMGELQFLPYVRSFAETGNPFNGTFFNAGKYDGEFAKSAADCANHDFAWQTHWAFGQQADWRDDPEADPSAWGIYDSNGGMKVSPYADQELMMAAIANTPYDWIVASENDKMDLSKGRKYCFGPSSSEAKVQWEELLKVAAGIKNEIGGNPNWEERYRRAETWDDTGSTLFGADMGSDFHDVDRKYLYSYWKNCFGNEQQLFLIFVRAEPTVMGGSAAGHTPSQLGARAVALVWREPVSTIRDASGGMPPHRMRILFYHQLD